VKIVTVVILFVVLFFFFSFFFFFFFFLFLFLIYFLVVFFCISFFNVSSLAYCILHAEVARLRKALERGGKEMARNFFVYPARNSELHSQQRILNLPQHELVAYGKTRFLTLGDAAVRLFEQLAAVIGAMEVYLNKHKKDTKVYVCVHIYERLCLYSLTTSSCFVLSGPSHYPKASSVGTQQIFPDLSRR
jgi:hypothetical protein